MVYFLSGEIYKTGRAGRPALSLGASPYGGIPGRFPKKRSGGAGKKLRQNADGFAGAGGSGYVFFVRGLEASDEIQWERPCVGDKCRFLFFARL